MFKSLLFISSCCAVLVFAEPIRSLQRDLTSIRHSTCDKQSIKDVAGQITDLTEATAAEIWTSVKKIAYDSWCCFTSLGGLWMCLQFGLEIQIYDNYRMIAAHLAEYFNALPPLLEQLSEDVLACATI